MISIDTKKKELIGDFAREGHTHTQAPIETLDHDFPSVGQGKLIPHGIYDVARVTPRDIWRDFARYLAWIYR